MLTFKNIQSIHLESYYLQKNFIGNFCSGMLVEKYIKDGIQYVKPSDGSSVYGIIDDNYDYNELSIVASGKINVWKISTKCIYKTDQHDINFEHLINEIQPLINNKKVLKHSDSKYEYLHGYGEFLYCNKNSKFTLNYNYDPSAHGQIAQLVEFDTDLNLITLVTL